MALRAITRSVPLKWACFGQSTAWRAGVKVTDKSFMQPRSSSSLPKQHALDRNLVKSLGWELGSHRVLRSRSSLSTCMLIYIMRRPFRNSSAPSLEKQEGEKTDLPAPAKPKLPYTPHEQIYNLPNFLTFTRILATPAVGYFILHDQTIPALALLITAGITDVLDGWIARKWKLQTVVGSVVDPMADKLLITVLTVTLAMKALLPVWLAVIILGRDAGLAISAIWYRYISLPPPKTFMRYWNFSLPSAEVRPTTISKVNTLLQLGLITASTAAPILPISAIAMVAAQYTVGVTTVWSGLSYVFSKNAVKILKQPAEGQEEGDGESGNDGMGGTKP